MMLRIAAAVALAGMVMLTGCAKSTVVRSPSASRAPASAAPSRPPASGKSITVRKGDTLYRIAKAQGVSALDLAMWNRIAPPYTIHPGQTLRLSAPEAPKPTRPSTPPQTAANRPAPGGSNPATGKPGDAARPGATDKPATDKPGTDKPGARPVATTPTRPAPGAGSGKPAAPVATPAPDAGFAWRWPADGSIVGRFIAGDPTRQGIDIAGKSGAPVRAAADGVVVYSGAGLVGYGELIIIKHSEQWLSAYGHNRARLVNEGQRVKAGEQIAEMGRSGASRDMLHFEIRYNGKPQDPLLALPKR
ncbi:peptidoglycan DD-metalloendopeptidase family protein [Lysobacter brunescens]|uniref:Peptidoglycan DD-metalloendopeptidase family protein n=1 Tax=Lysobacter brunescens TaxID=262323 RepID=A0ABW2YEI0_9GAMM